MENHCHAGAGCLIMGVGLYLAWLLIASGLLMMTWNRVIGGVAKVKQVKYWQPLLLLVTLSVLCAPRMYMKMHHHHGRMCHYQMGCCGSSDCQGDKSEKGDCPYSHAGGTASADGSAKKE